MANRPLRVDWPLISNKMEADGVDPSASCLVCMPVASVYLLQAICERLTWKATYRTGGYDFDDWEDLQTYAEDAQEALNPMCDDIVSQIITQVTNNTTTVINNQAQQDAMCCYLSDGNPVNVPPPDDETPPPSTLGDLEELCKRAQAAHDQGHQFLQEAFDLGEVFGAFTVALVAALLTGFVLILPAALVLAFVAAIVALLADDYTDDAIVAWDALKHSIVCCFVSGANATAIKTCIDSAIDDAVAEGELPSAVGTAFKAIYNYGTINSIIAGDEGYNTAGYDASYCLDCADIMIGGYYYEVTEWEGAEANQISVGGWTGMDGEMNGSTEWDIPPYVPYRIANTLPELAGGFGVVDLAFETFVPPAADPALLSIGIGRQGIGSRDIDSIKVENFRLLVSYNGGATYVNTTLPITPSGFDWPLEWNWIGNYLYMTDPTTIGGNTYRDGRLSFDMSP